MTNLEKYTRLVEEAVANFSLPQDPNNLYDPLRYFMTLGGKRMRPILTLMATEAFGAQAQEGIQAALAVELFHNFSLIHDDIMDNAPLRRAQATVHEKWNSNIAILSGDVLLVKAYQCLASYEPSTLKALFEVFNQTAIEVCEGQQMDMDFEQRSNVSEAEYIEMIRLKTSVLLGCALKMGAIIGGANAQSSAHIYQFGVQLGLAFQIQDDLLDLFGESAAVGKQIGGDVLANKKTLLSIAANSLANERQKVELVKLNEIQDPELKVKFAQDLYTQIGAKAYCQNQMETFHSSALQALDELQNISSKTPFLELAAFLLHRNH
jgi:geranylgeranyl diphosphate synthase type II